MPSSQIREYTLSEISQELAFLGQSYDLVRLVDPEECRVLSVAQDGTVTYENECHHVWNSKQRCANCSSYRACMTHITQYKTEIFQQKRFEITSVPIYLRMQDNELTFCVMEMIRVFPLDEENDESEDTVGKNPLYYSTHDVLTGLYNREEAFRQIRLRMKKDPGRKYLLITSNIRQFHLINALFGQDTGNKVLIGIANLFREICSEEDVYARITSDRFLLFTPKDKFDEKEFLEQLQRVRSLILSPSYNLQIHLGIYEIQDPNIPVSIMMERSELARNAIRNSHGKMSSWYTEGLMEQHLEDQWIVGEFEKSLKADQFRIYLQPQVTLDGKILGAEVLVRWIRSDGSMVPVARFIPVLAQSDLISRMDQHVWEMAVKQLAAWKGTALEHLYLSINVDPRDFFYMDVPDCLSGLCNRYGVDVSMLHVEVTENALAEGQNLPEDALDSLRKRGFVLEIDDFGKGSSSLSMLKDVPVDVLKIDMGFLRETEHEIRSRIILESVIQMAGKLETPVIVEGVETPEQEESIRNMGCEMYQGFLFSKPVPVDVFEALYLKTRPESAK